MVRELLDRCDTHLAGAGAGAGTSNVAIVNL